MPHCQVIAHVYMEDPHMTEYTVSDSMVAQSMYVCRDGGGCLYIKYNMYSVCVSHVGNLILAE